MTSFKFTLLSAVLLSVSLISQQAYAELAVIAHPDNALMGLSRDELRDIYLGKARSFPGGGRVEAVDQSAGSVARDKFNKDVLKMSESQRKSHWSRLTFTGKGKPPRSLASDEEILDWVAGQPHGVGYIQGSKVNKRVKVLLILP